MSAEATVVGFAGRGRVTSQGIPRGQLEGEEGKGPGRPFSTLRRKQPCQHLAVSPVKPSSNFGPPKL